MVCDDIKAGLGQSGLTSLVQELGLPSCHSTVKVIYDELEVTIPSPFSEYGETNIFPKVFSTFDA